GVVALCARCAKKIFSSDISGDRDNTMLMVEIYLTRDVAVALDADEFFSGTVTPEEKFDIQRKLDRLADDMPEAADCGVYETAVASLVRSHIGTGGINRHL
ncbi:hypothetical protein, partial [uncultured Corynebacterium sp.]|uniref:hypothetical protein n=1 Tax=uncultured Corynebacterium sp. TaxID=159447 RepID=UPI0025EDD687